MDEGFCYDTPEEDPEFRHYIKSQGFELYGGLSLNLHATRGQGQSWWFCTADDPETVVSGIRVPGDYSDGREAVAAARRYIDEHIQTIQHDLAELVREKKQADQDQSWMWGPKRKAE